MINSNEKFSYSKLSTYEQCPYKYKLTYVDKHFINQPAIATDIGTLIHETEESIANQIKNNLFGVIIDYDYLKKNLKEKFDEIKKKYPDAIKEKDKSGRLYSEKINYYLEKGIYRLETLFQENENLEIVDAEKEFNLEYNGYLFHGFIDRIFYDRYRQKYIIEDIKTYAIPVTKESLATPLQFVVYTLALSNMLNIPLEHIECKYDLPFCDLKQDAGTKGFIERGKKKLDKLFSKIEADEFEPKASPLCHWCIFSKTYIDGQPEEAKGLCPYFCHWTRAKKDMSVEYEWMGAESDKAIVESFNKNLINDIKKEESIEKVMPKIEIDSERRFLIRR